MIRQMAPARFPVGGLLHRHAAKVKRDGIDMLAELHAAEQHVVAALGRPLTDAERCRFRESIRDAHRKLKSQSRIAKASEAHLPADEQRQKIALRELGSSFVEMAIACTIAAPFAFGYMFWMAVA